MLASCAREQNVIDLLLIRYVLAYSRRGRRDAWYDGQETMSTRLRIEHEWIKYQNLEQIMLDCN